MDTAIDYHVDVVGSLLRPDYLLEARENFRNGNLRPGEFKAIEDRAVRVVVSLQEELGLPILTDGEMRRESFQSKFIRQVEGFGEAGRDAFLWGDWHSDEFGDLSIERPEQLGVTGPLENPEPIFLEEFVTLRTLTDRVPKITIPSPGLFLNFWSDDPTSAYDTRADFMSDVIAILGEEIDRLSDYGLRYLQVDAPHYPLLLDEDFRSFYTRDEESLEDVLSRWVQWDNQLIGGRDDLTIGMHLCRGNQASRWLVEGSYEPLAEPLFERLDVDRFLLEYDDDRSGGFKPLRKMPEEKMVLLGLLTTKHSGLEDVSQLRDQVEDAAQYHPKTGLGLCPQCGFSSSTLGNELSWEDQKQKLNLLVEASNEIW